MPSTLTNESRQVVVVMLDHPAFLTPDRGWRRTTVSVASQNESGARIVSELRRSYPGSLTLQPGQSVSGLHNAISKCSQVQGLLAAKVLSIRTEAKR